MKTIHCDRCGIEIYDNKTGTEMWGISFKVNLSEEQEKEKSVVSLLKKQMGEYQIGKGYYICWGCVLKMHELKP